MIPLYIIGILLRFGPQHGYQIKKLMGEQLEDFTQIKLPTVYYHLEKMEAAGYITAQREKQGSRPEKTVYQVSETGEDKFKELLKQNLKIEYRPTFDIDGTLYFSDYLENNELVESLSNHMAKLENIISSLEVHRNETLRYIPEEYKTTAEIIFQHHLFHYRAELAWAQQSLQSLKEDEFSGKNENY